MVCLPLILRKFADSYPRIKAKTLSSNMFVLKDKHKDKTFLIHVTGAGNFYLSFSCRLLLFIFIYVIISEKIT